MYDCSTCRFCSDLHPISLHLILEKKHRALIKHQALIWSHVPVLPLPTSSLMWLDLNTLCFHSALFKMKPKQQWDFYRHSFISGTCCSNQTKLFNVLSVEWNLRLCYQMYLCKDWKVQTIYGIKTKKMHGHCIAYYTIWRTLYIKHFFVLVPKRKV